MTTREQVARYIERGFKIVPYPTRLKGPRTEEWQRKTYTLDDVTEGDNIGVITGVEIERDKFLVDLDFDWSPGIAHAKRFFPPTGFGFGRASRPFSHAFYTVSKPLPLVAYRSIDNKTTYAELRGTTADGGEARQTMLPPSVHPTGEIVTLKMDGEIRHDDSVPRATVLYAITCLLLDTLGPKGFTHDDARLGLAGYLLRSGLTVDEVVTVGEAIADGTDNTVADVAVTVRTTAQRVDAGEKVKGRGALVRHIGDNGPKVVERIEKWLGREDERKQAVAELNRSYFVVGVGADTVVAEQIERSSDNGARRWTDYNIRTFDDFRRKLIKRRVQVGWKNGIPNVRPLADVWLESPDGRQYERLVYAPPGSEEAVGERDLNGWQGFTVTPAPGDWTRTRDEFIRDVVCRGDETIYQWVLDWMAALFQRPGRHAETALVLISEEHGAGKNFFGDDVLARTFDGRHARVTRHTNQVLGEFNDILSGLCVLVLDEVGLTTPAQYNAVKSLVTGHTNQINRKHIAAATEPSMLHVLFLSNDEVPLRVAPTDRRFAFLRLANTHVNDTRFFAAIERELNEGGRAAMLHDLLARPVDWDRLRRAPDTSPKQQAKQESWSSATWFWFKELRACGPSEWNGETYRGRLVRLVNKEEACSRYEDHVRASNSRQTVQDARTDLHRELKRILPAEFQDAKSFDFNRARSIKGALRRNEWTLPEWDVFARAFAAAVRWTEPELLDALADVPVPEQLEVPS